MVRLTRGIDLVYEAATGRLRAGRLPRAELGLTALRLWATLQGEPDRTTGLLVNVSQIDAAIQTVADQGLPIRHVEDVLTWAVEVLRASFPTFPVRRVQLDLAPTVRIAYLPRPEGQPMIEITRQYELAASHRLCNPDWDEQRNFKVFGQCSNPRGHGHNYLLHVTWRGKTRAQTGQVLDLQAADRLVRQEVLERFDHKNLNEDTPEFARLIPTVENMAQVFWELLDGRLPDVQLARVRVWETEKTYAEYAGPAAGPLRYSDAV